MNTKQNLDQHGLSVVLNDCISWLDNKAEQIRAYSPEDKDEAINLKKVRDTLQHAINQFNKN